MISSKWVFKRDERSIAGFLSADRASTDAISTLLHWEQRAPGRSYEVLHEEDEAICVALTCDPSDMAAVSDLDRYCTQFGVQRRPLKS